MKNSLLLLLCIMVPSQSDTIQTIERQDLQSFSTIARSSLMAQSKTEAWETVVPQVQSITIRSTADSTDQPALFYNSGSPKMRPLLIALHSWSDNFQQQYSIPYGKWAVKNDWVFIHPDHRGPYTNPQATASELAIQDIMDAINYAKNNAAVDTSRIYLIGFSGGGMTALILAGRYPSSWTAVCAWVPVYDLVQWYRTTKNAAHGYAIHIKNSCGGAPLSGTDAYRECKRRSAGTYLANAKNRPVQVYIISGIEDRFVPPGHALQAFNDLADSSDFIQQKDIDYIDTHSTLPGHLRSHHNHHLFSKAGHQLLFSRQSNNALIHIYSGDHDIIYNIGLLWLSRQKR